MWSLVITPVALSVTLALSLLLSALPSAAQETQPHEVSPFPLAEALERVHAVAPQRRAAQARIQAAEGAMRQANRLPNPSLDLHQENLGAGAPVDQTLDVFAIISQPVEIGGKRAARTAVAAANVRAAQAAVRQAERNLALETVRLYLGALQAHSFTEFLSRSHEELQTLVIAMTRRVAEGYTAEADLMKFYTEMARMETQLVRAKLHFNQSITELSALLDLSPPLIGSRLVMPPMIDPPPGDPTELAQQAVERQPEIIAAQARLDHARHTLVLEKARRLPDPALTAGYKRTGGADTLVTGVSVPLPVFDRNADNIDRATAEEHAAALELEALRKQRLAVTVTLMQAAQELAERARNIDQQLLQPAEVVRNAAHVSFREGAANILQLVDAERVYTETRREALELKLDAYAKTFEARLLLTEEGQP
jgi:cobalt-zinc-cadmium efflux system outer membrane protein